MLPASLTSFLVPFVELIIGHRTSPQPVPPALNFQLRHVHAVSPSAHVWFSDVSERNVGTQSYSNTSYTMATRRVTTWRPPSFDAISQARLHSMRFGQSQSLGWGEDEIEAPDHENRETLLLLAKMAENAYVEPGDPYWYDLGGTWNQVRSFRWLQSNLSLNRTPKVTSFWLGRRCGRFSGTCLRYT